MSRRIVINVDTILARQVLLDEAESRIEEPKAKSKVPFTATTFVARSQRKPPQPQQPQQVEQPPVIIQRGYQNEVQARIAAKALSDKVREYAIRTMKYK